MSKKKSTSSKIGRPTKYKPEYCQELIEFFEVAYEQVVEQVASQGKAVDVIRYKLSRFPTIEGFCANILISKDAFHKWIAKYPEFNDAYSIAKQKQKNALIQGGLAGDFNAGFAKFVAINCTDMIDKSEVKNENETTVKGYGLAFNLGKHPDEVD